MKSIRNPVKEKYSCFITTDYSKIVCILTFTQKLESEPFIKVSFKDESNTRQQNIIHGIIDYLILCRCAVTQVHIEFIELVKGLDAFSVYLNLFSIVARIAKLEVKDYLCSATITENDYQVHLAYLLNKKQIINLYSNGPVENLLNTLKLCIKEAENNARLLFDELS